jgi:hypothetical protein
MKLTREIIFLMSIIKLSPGLLILFDHCVLKHICKSENKISDFKRKKDNGIIQSMVNYLVLKIHSLLNFSSSFFLFLRSSTSSSISGNLVCMH